MKYVLLTEDESTILVACPDDETAESVGRSAVFNDGGVSAWLVPAAAVTDYERVEEILSGGGSISEIFEADLPDAWTRATPEPLRGYLDLRTKMLPENEWSEITGAPPRVIEHGYGAWVHVQPAGPDIDPLDEEDWEDFPRLNAVLREARRLGADWVNFDQDGRDELPGLPTFDW